jgi:hypothetical protein
VILNPCCIVPGCDEPEEHLEPVGDGWGMCHRHRQAERNAVRECEVRRELELDELDPLRVCDRREREARQAEQRRREAFDRIDTSRWVGPDGTRYGLAALENEVRDLRAAGVPGNRRNALNDAAFNLGGLVAGGELREGAVRQVLTFCAQAIELPPREAADTIRYGLRDGFNNPRSAPA